MCLLVNLLWRSVWSRNVLEQKKEIWFEGMYVRSGVICIIVCMCLKETPDSLGLAFANQLAGLTR